MQPCGKKRQRAVVRALRCDLGKPIIGKPITITWAVRLALFGRCARRVWGMQQGS